MFKGAFSALVTPFKNDRIDESALKTHVKNQIDGGIDGLVPCGTTGESATLTHEEHDRVVELVIDSAKEYSNGKKVPVIAGAGSNSTKETIRLTSHAQKAGADAALLISPYYNKPTPNGVYEHYRAVSESTDLPLIIYNVPGRTSLNMLPDTVARISELKNIVGIKEATGDLSQVSDVIEYSKKGFCILSGDDATTLPQMALGAVGTISVTSNLVPGEMSAMCKFMNEGTDESLNEAKKLHFKMQALNRVMFIETNPIPVKTALAMMGIMEEEFRLPLVGMTKTNRDKLEQALKTYGLIK